VSDVLEIRVKKSHVAVLSVVVLVASASAAVNVRDPMNVFGDLDMQGNEIQNTTQVEFSYDYLKDYAAQDGKIDIDGLAQAGREYARGEISAQELRTVKIYHAKQVPVTNDFMSDIDRDNNGKIDIDELAFAGREFARGNLNSEELDTAGYYFATQKEVSEPPSISAARKTGNGKLMATGILGTGDSNFTVSTNINMRGNNIYNAGNLNGGTRGTGGGGGSTSNTAPALDWSNARPVKDEVTDGTAEIECNPGEVLRDVTCFKVGRLGGSDAEGDDVLKCDTRTEGSASESAGNAPDISVRPGVSGTCVPLKGVKRQLFSNQNSSNTFQVPPGTSSVRYRVYGGVGGSEGGSSGGGAGGYVEGSIPVDGETTLNVYVGQNGGNGVQIVDYSGITEDILTLEIEGSGGRGGCVPFNGVKCGGDGGDGFLNRAEYDISEVVSSTDGAGGGGAPTILTDSADQIMVAAGGGGGESSSSGGGGGAGGGKGGDFTDFDANAGEDADTATTKNLGGNADEPGDTFVRSGLPAADSTGTSREGAKVELAAFP